MASLVRCGCEMSPDPGVSSAPGDVICTVQMGPGPPTGHSDSQTGVWGMEYGGHAGSRTHKEDSSNSMGEGVEHTAPP